MNYITIIQLFLSVQKVIKPSLKNMFRIMKLYRTEQKCILNNIVKFDDQKGYLM